MHPAKDGVCRNEKEISNDHEIFSSEIIKDETSYFRVYIVTELNYPWLTEFFYGSDSLPPMVGFMGGSISSSALFCCLCSVLPVAALPIEPLTIQFLGRFFVSV